MLISDDTNHRSLANPHMKREKALVMTSPGLDIIAERSENDYSVRTPSSEREYLDRSGDDTAASHDSYRSSTISISL